MRLSSLFILAFLLFPSGVFALVDKGNGNLDQKVKESVQSSAEKTQLQVEEEDSQPDENERTKEKELSSTNKQDEKEQSNAFVKIDTQTANQEIKLDTEVSEQKQKKEITAQAQVSNRGKSVTVQEENSSLKQVKKKQITSTVELKPNDQNGKQVKVSIQAEVKNANKGREKKQDIRTKIKNEIRKTEPKDHSNIEKSKEVHRVKHPKREEGVSDSSNERNQVELSSTISSTNQVEESKLDIPPDQSPLPTKEHQQQMLVILTASPGASIPSKGQSSGLNVSIPQLQIYETVNADVLPSVQTQVFGTRVEIFRNQWVNAPPFQPPKN